MVIQNAKVNCPILSVKYFTNKGCRVLFRRGGGVIAFPDGRRIPFIERLGVFFVCLNVLPPDLVPAKDAFDRPINHPSGIQPGFARPGSDD